MPSIRIINKVTGKVEKRSRNLRGILDYARTERPVTSIVAWRTRDGDKYRVHFRFGRYVFCTVLWADLEVLDQWIYNRWSWGRPHKEVTPQLVIYSYD